MCYSNDKIFFNYSRFCSPGVLAFHWYKWGKKKQQGIAQKPTWKENSSLDSRRELLLVRGKKVKTQFTWGLFECLSSLEYCRDKWRYSLSEGFGKGLFPFLGRGIHRQGHVGPERWMVVLLELGLEPLSLSDEQSPLPPGLLSFSVGIDLFVWMFSSPFRCWVGFAHDAAQWMFTCDCS